MVIAIAILFARRHTRFGRRLTSTKDTMNEDDMRELLGKYERLRNDVMQLKATIPEGHRARDLAQGRIMAFNEIIGDIREMIHLEHRSGV